ncbi:hypothetical protein D9758_013273 [Tetrapyrgos nigripes]|uniref:Uncharacterized protein n=1 Tax=Tetrapyrgos nigripes TaxID=182062 RepID=A0A8H5CNW7_9AGAR|nr:hypothetical protein D9758_013273 [Tetrapyrgos nigripes]
MSHIRNPSVASRCLSLLCHVAKSKKALHNPLKAEDVKGKVRASDDDDSDYEKASSTLALTSTNSNEDLVTLTLLSISDMGPVQMGIYVGKNRGDDVDSFIPPAYPQALLFLCSTEDMRAPSSGCQDGLVCTKLAYMTLVFIFQDAGMHGLQARFSKEYWDEKTNSPRNSAVCRGLIGLVYLILIQPESQSQWLRPHVEGILLPPHHLDKDKPVSQNCKGFAFAVLSDLEDVKLVER